MRDFTHSRYYDFLRMTKQNGYIFQQSIANNTIQQKSILLRHDIDAMPLKALSIAKVENNIGAKASFFFKIHPDIFIPGIIRQISGLNHDIGYHYEDLVNHHGNYSKAISDFERNLDKFRKIFPVTAICADGNPLSKYNNLWLWEKYDYKRYGITCEMYLDIDYDEYAYFTDTGRCWDGDKFNVWDHVKTNKPWPHYHTTSEIINAVETGTFPKKAAINVHPQRWNENFFGWTKELVAQNIKNMIKLGLKRVRNNQTLR